MDAVQVRRAPVVEADAYKAVGRMVAVLDEDPELAAALPPGRLGRARALAVAPLLEARSGSYPRHTAAVRDRGDLGMLLLDGVALRIAAVSGEVFPELLGPGDLLRPWAQEASGSLVVESSWRALTALRLARLDRAFAVRVAEWPEITAGLIERTMLRSRRLAVQHAIRQNPRVEERIWRLLWLLADRFSRVTAEGRVLRIPGLTHELLAGLAGCRRAPVTRAIGHLRDEGHLRKLPGGALLLCGSPPGDLVASPA